MFKVGDKVKVVIKLETHINWFPGMSQYVNNEKVYCVLSVDQCPVLGNAVFIGETPYRAYWFPFDSLQLVEKVHV